MGSVLSFFFVEESISLPPPHFPIIFGLLPGKNDFWGGIFNPIFVFFLREVTFSLFVRDYWGGLSQRERDEIGVGSSVQRKSRGVGLTIIAYY